MARWRGRRRSSKKAPSESDSVGRTGAALPQQNVEPLQPLYPGMDEVRETAPESDDAVEEAQPSSSPQQQAATQPLTRSQRRRRGRKRARAARMQQQPAAAAAEAQQPAPAEPPPVTAEVPEDSGEEAQAAPAPAAHGRQHRGVVVLAIGLPGSGKSSWFKRRGVMPLSSDLVRTLLFDDATEQRFQHLVFSTLRAVLRARMIAHMPSNYVDATNLDARERKHWIQMAREFGYDVHAVFFDVPLEVCQERNQRRQRVVPADVMEKMAARLQPPHFEEGFSKITVVRVKR